MTLRSVSPAYIAAKERAKAARAEDGRKGRITEYEAALAKALAKEGLSHLRSRRRRFSWNPRDWIPS